MHHRIVTILAQLRQDLAPHLDRPAILDTCRAAGHTWRDCLLDPIAVLHLFLTRVLHDNTTLAHLPRLGLVSNPVRVAALEAARRQGVAVERISLIDVLRWLADVRPDESLPALVVKPHRPPRFEPRSTKRHRRSTRGSPLQGPSYANTHWSSRMWLILVPFDRILLANSHRRLACRNMGKIVGPAVPVDR